MHSALYLLDKLISLWDDFDQKPDYYLRDSIPSIIAYRDLSRFSFIEKKLIQQLKSLMSEEEWNNLANLIEERRTGRLHVLRSDKERHLGAKRELRPRDEEELRLEAIWQLRPRDEEELRRWAAEERRLRGEWERRRREEAEERRRRDEEERRRREEEERRRREKEEERRRREEEERRRRVALVQRIRHALETDYLNADRVFASDPDASLLSAEEYRRLKVDFVREWSRRELGLELDDEQAAAVALAAGNTLVVARAGSGKTTALTARAAFLQKHCRIEPRELLLLAFNRDAANEMKKRLRTFLGENVPHVMTFHALAHAIVKPLSRILSDQKDEDQLDLSKFIQDVIDDLIRSERYADRIKQFMLAYYKEDWDQIIRNKFNLPIAHFLAYRRSLERETLAGEFVKSYGEKLIANILFEHGIEYKYEKPFRWGESVYRPDFTIYFDNRRGGLIIEYFGLKGEPDYDALAEDKIRYWGSRPQWNLIYFSSEDISRHGPDRFASILLGALDRFGIRYRKLSDHEIWAKVKHRAIDRFTEAVVSFVNRARALGVSADDLREKVLHHSSISQFEADFLEVACEIYDSYVDRLASQNLLDFPGLLWSAVERIKNGETSFVRDRGRESGNLKTIKYVLVDEFQDMSTAFIELLLAIKGVSDSSGFFGVGDNWQAINRFAGADIRYFGNFEDIFTSPYKFLLLNNYRSDARIVETGNAIMAPSDERGGVAVSRRDGEVMIFDMAKWRSRDAEKQRHGDDEITPAALRLIWHCLSGGQRVLVLFRARTIPWYIRWLIGPGEKDGVEALQEHFRSAIPERLRGMVTVNTAHSAKGKEEDAVIVLDARDGRFPLIHPLWVTGRVFGDSLLSIGSDERRLFYVAATRAKHALYFVTDSRRGSTFLAGVRSHANVASGDWRKLAGPPCVAIEAEAGPGRKLSRYGFRPVRAGRGDGVWRKDVPLVDFSWDRVLSQLRSVDLLGVRAIDDEGNVLHEWSAGVRRSDAGE
ncbi:MAG: hypothetical protein KatS3mg082_3193 [Nitrospiraceae bacterium]|nr:MAG: hypothetical protein KatS3mg082_3183 [Nitrospiraceae bacterium]GIW56789.1 MAG: hypothetical protein KatS3mg082_3193 [Nitrospiraceae bacterium]